MKFLFVIASFVLAINASTDEELWIKFKQDHGKTYKSLREDKLRFEVFKSNLKTIEEHNTRYENGQESWFMGVNKFTDLTDEEFQAKYLHYEPIEGGQSNDSFVPPLNNVAPEEIDWREKGAVRIVEDQEDCGSCWAFSAIGAIEGQNAIKHGINLVLSPQELVDCSESYENFGCSGGWPDNAFRYIRDHGISKLSDYPYTGKEDTCKPTHNSGKIRITGFTDIMRTEHNLKHAVGTIGPVAAGINSIYMKNYAGGIFDNFSCKDNLDHSVLIVGYGTEDHHDYWIVKNSWGTTWGEKGYIKMTRNRFNQCGIATRASYPHLQ